MMMRQSLVVMAHQGLAVPNFVNVIEQHEKQEKQFTHRILSMMKNSYLAAVTLHFFSFCFFFEKKMSFLCV